MSWRTAYFLGVLAYLLFRYGSYVRATSRNRGPFWVAVYKPVILAIIAVILSWTVPDAAEWTGEYIMVFTEPLYYGSALVVIYALSFLGFFRPEGDTTKPRR